MIPVAPVVAQSSRNFLEMNSMLCVSGQKKIVKINPKLEKLFKIFKNGKKIAPLKKNMSIYGLSIDSCWLLHSSSFLTAT